MVDIKDMIIEYNNPVNQESLLTICDNFEYVSYDKYINNIYRVIETVGVTNKAVAILTTITRSVHEVLSDMGIKLNDDEHINIVTLSLIFDAVVKLDTIDPYKTDLYLDIIESGYSNVDILCKILNDITSITYSRLYPIIDSVNDNIIESIKSIYTELNNVVKSDDDTEELLHKLKRHMVLNKVLKSITANVGIDDKIVSLIDDYKSYNLDVYINVGMNEDISFKDYDVISVEYMVLLILGKDSRFKRIEYYREYMEPVIEDKGLALLTVVFNKIVELNDLVDEKISKYDVYDVFNDTKEVVKNGEFN